MLTQVSPASNVDAAASFLEEFRLRHGRAPRILHIGNIANNAFLNAKLLNRAGFDCDVICYDYYHSMACPEWEDADFEGTLTDHLHPDWTALDLKGYERPRWFVQGPQLLCLDYLIAKRTGDTPVAEKLWRFLGQANGTVGAATLPEQPAAVTASTWQRVAGRTIDLLRKARSSPQAHLLVWEKLEVWASCRGWLAYFLVAIASPLVHAIVSILRAWTWISEAARPNALERIWVSLHQRARSSNHAIGHLFYSSLAPFAMLPALSIRSVAILLGRGSTKIIGDADAINASSSADPYQSVAAWSMRFKEVFPDRPDQLADGDCIAYTSVLPRWRALLQQYDIVQAYATDVVYPLLCAKRPYLGFEHGTLRDFTLGDSATCRLTAWGYHDADHVFITNGDCLEYARRIGVSRFTPMVHPLDDRRIRSIVGEYDELHRVHGVKYLFLCPLRHDWAVKGTDRYIRALPRLADELRRDFRVIMTRWGMQLDDSIRLAKELGVDDLIVWEEPLNRGRMVRMQKSCDVVFDQIALPHFGATAPQAIAAGVPVVMSYDPESTRWIIPESAPILSAWTPDEVVDAVHAALDPQWRANYVERAQDWFDTYHSGDRAVALNATAYRAVACAGGLL